MKQIAVVKAISRIFIVNDSGVLEARLLGGKQ